MFSHFVNGQSEVLALLLSLGLPVAAAQLYAPTFEKDGFDSIQAVQTMTAADMEPTESRGPAWPLALSSNSTSGVPTCEYILRNLPLNWSSGCRDCIIASVISRTEMHLSSLIANISEHGAVLLLCLVVVSLPHCVLEGLNMLPEYVRMI